jgi:ankyrin repeat protein
MRIGRLAGFALVMTAVASPLAAQLSGSNSEAFLSAVRGDDIGKAIELLNAHGSTVVNYRGYSGETALHIVARRRDGQWLGYLLAKGADPDVGDKNGDTALIIVSRIGYDEGARTLLASRAKVDAANRLGETPLIIAVQQRHTQLVRQLLEAGADPDKADHAAGYSARDYAKQDRRSTESLKLIESVKSTRKAVAGPSIK